MNDCRDDHSIWSKVRKLLPTIILVTLTLLAGGTDLFSAKVHELVSASLATTAAQMLPYLLNVLLLLTFVNIAWLIYHPMVCTIEKLLFRTSVKPQLRQLIRRGLCISYWFGIFFVSVTVFNPDLMAKLAMGFGLITAAITWALGGVLNDIVCGLLLQATNSLKEGDVVKIADIGIAEGTVLEIGYVRTRIDNTDLGPVTVPNSKIWISTIANKRKKSLLLKP